MQHSLSRLARLADAVALCLAILFLSSTTSAWTQQQTPQASPPSITEQQVTPEQVATPQTPSSSRTASPRNGRVL
jgi:hypothetical protein